MDLLIAETSINIWFQGLGTSLLPVFNFFSSLGTEHFFLLIIPFIYWTVDSKTGVKLALMLLISGGLNTIVKYSFQAPRPYWITPEVKALAGETSFGFPSGHSQNSLSVFGLFSLSTRRQYLKATIAIIIILIGLSRIYLGVHFLTDVLAGWVMGLILIGIFVRLGSSVSGWFLNKPFQVQVVISFFSSLLIVILTLIVQYFTRDWQFPTAWVENIKISNFPQQFNPLDGSDMITIAGMWFGVLAGFSWIQIRYPGYRIQSTPTRQFIMYLTGMIGLMVLWYGLGSIFPRTSDLTGISLRYLRYFLVGLWITGAAPILFYKFKLRSIV